MRPHNELSEPGSPAIRVLALAALAIRAAFIVLYRIDPDEPQHLHVVWAWSRGLVQYRDVFDNHLPLLHMMFAPLMRLLPESSSVFLSMRLAIAPFAIASSYALYLVGRDLLGVRHAAVAAILFSVMPVWLPKSVEFRNDTLWIFFWLLALAFLVARSRWSLFFAGVAAGLCLLASVKAAPIFLAHGLAMASQRRSIRAKEVAQVVAGFAVPILIITAILSLLGAFHEMVYDTILFNASVPVALARRTGGALALLLLAPVLLLRGSRIARGANPLVNHLVLFAIWYVTLLCCLWPILAPRDFLPILPLAALLIPARAKLLTSPAIAVLTGTLVAGCYVEMWRPLDRARQRFVDAVVELTGPDDYVLDLKGDSIFRRRPVHTVYEIVSRSRIRNGTLPDLGPEEIAERGCCVAMADATHLPARTRAFLKVHFIERGPLRVCGTEGVGGAFEIGVPQVYAVIADDPASVRIDGTPYRGPRFLAAGRHSLASQGSDPVRVIWWRAARKSR